MIELTAELVLELAEQQVARMGEYFVYAPEGARTCYYLPQTHLPEGDPEQQTGCFVGSILTAAGVLNETLRQYEYRSALTLLYVLIDDGLVCAPHHLGPAMLAAQRMQDRGETWGEALRVLREGLGV